MNDSILLVDAQTGCVIKRPPIASNETVMAAMERALKHAAKNLEACA